MKENEKGRLFVYKGNNVKVEKRIHSGWLENDKIKAVGVEPIFEKWQYIYANDKEEISLIQFTKRMYEPYNWEIYQIKGEKPLFDDVERFKTKKEAEVKILKYLDNGN